MQGVKRRVVYVGLYELVAIVLSAILLKLISNADAVNSFGIAVVASAIAILWNLAFNYGFELWEKHRKYQGRSLGIRVLHAVGFEGGLLIFLVPIIAWWLEVGLFQALLMDLGLLVFFLFYTFTFNWVFDAVFGLPAGVAANPVTCS
ncbi:PACE efflux transporter [Cellvibrio fibrivorans]|uniref:Membrane protein n=1 Tax=Cellvibrio fibrivorans TaxID=126350 RepID=A0ABU1V1U5_9GAMM|nr:PACE efflux transporter [Cellvibrio fibrivorans]MDR7091416.1 putative membrane protein [Cellvibrio fibrivorans]